MDLKPGFALPLAFLLVATPILVHAGNPYVGLMLSVVVAVLVANFAWILARFVGCRLSVSKYVRGVRLALDHRRAGFQPDTRPQFHFAHHHLGNGPPRGARKP
ncbi:MAG: hypothetical protein WDN31_19050 [Hyphomicrobium sp.]